MSKSRRGKRAAGSTRKQARGRLVGALAVLALVVVGAGLWGWLAFGRVSKQPDILLISVDTLRADRLGCYGYRTRHTPNIDRLAAGAVVFDAVTSPVPITLPSHASMLTGLIPARHGARLNVGHHLPDAVTTLAEVLQEQGYQTGGFVGGLPMVRASGLAQGFEVYDDQLTQMGWGDSAVQTRQERYAEEVCAAALTWLRSTDSTRPAFAFVHIFDPHAPYERALPGSSAPSYDGEIAYVDRVLGTFMSSLAEQARWRAMLTVLTSDHGEGLGEHREKTHGIFVYESTLRVPLIIHWPGVITPGRVRVPVGLIDVAPTILELAKLPGLSDVDGESLVSLIERPASIERAFYFESLLGALEYGWAPLRGIRRGDLKYISAPRPELYDLRADPHEANNLYAARPADAARLAEQVSAIGEGVRATVDMDPETIAGLESLGYISARPVLSDDLAERADPKDRIEVYERLHLAHTEFAQGRFDQALAIMEALESSFQRSPYFYSRWGDFAARTERWQRAVVCYQKCLALDERKQAARLNLGVAYLKCNDPAKSLEQFETLLQLNPDHAEAHLYAGEVKKRCLGAPADAIPHWRRFLELAPDHPQADKIRKALAELTRD